MASRIRRLATRTTRRITKHGSGHGRRPGPRRRPTLRRRLTLTAVGLLAVVAAIMGVTSTLALRASLLQQVDNRLVAAAARAGTATRTPPSAATAPVSTDNDADNRPPWFNGPGQEVGTVNVVTSGQVRSGYIGTDGAYRPLTSDQLATLLAVPTDGRIVPITLGDLGSYRAVAGRTDDGAVITAIPTASADATVRGYVMVELVVAVVGLAMTAAAANVLVRRGLQPLTSVAATATRVSELPLAKGEVSIDERVPDADPTTEVGQVGAAFNRMLGHVERALTARQESEQQVRRFVADASHELRTPLASIRGYTELVRRSDEPLPDGAGQALARVEAEAIRMTALVEDMLLLARLDAGRELERETVDLAELAVDAVADAHAAGPDHVWQLDVVADDEGADDPTTIVTGDDHRLRQVLANLLTNARVHTPAGTRIEVGVRREGGDVVVRVDDDGPGIPAELRERLFERFTRGDASRNHTAGSTGLGLAIASAVVHAHGGTLECASRPGRTVFTVTLPAATPAA
jgi:two-component system OmpR family sensor kinase